MQCKVCSSIRQSVSPRGKKRTGLRVESQRREYQAHTCQDTGCRTLLLWERRGGCTGITVEVKGLCIVEYIDTSGGAYSQRSNIVIHAWHYLAPGVRQILIAFGRSNSTTRPFELEERTDRPRSASRITSTGFLTTRYNMNASGLENEQYLYETHSVLCERAGSKRRWRPMKFCGGSERTFCISCAAEAESYVRG